MQPSFERGGEQKTAEDKVRNFCSKFEKCHIIEHEGMFVAEILDPKKNEQQAVYVFNPAGELLQVEAAADTLKKVVRNFGVSRFIYNDKEGHA